MTATKRHMLGPGTEDQIPLRVSLLLLPFSILCGTSTGGEITTHAGAISLSKSANPPILLAQAAAKSTAAAQSELNALIAGAKSEGELTFYSNALEVVGKRTGDRFTAKYGVKTAFLRYPGDAPLQRYSTDAEAGNIAADMLLNAGSPNIIFGEEGVKKGWLEPVSGAGLPVVRSGEFPARFMRGPIALVQFAPWIITYNTEKVKAADVPKDWPDLLKPQFKGQILVADVRCCSALAEFWKVILDKYGETFMTQLAGQIGRQYSSGVPAVQGLAAGEGMILLPTIVAQAQTVKDKGAPVDNAMPNYTTGLELYVLLTARAKAKHPNAARLFANYLMSPEGNKVLNEDPGGFTVYETARLPSQYIAPDPNAPKSVERLYKLLGSR